MKNLFYNLQVLLLSLLIVSCTFNGDDGAPGPRGPQGPPGQDGAEFEAIAYEFSQVSFSPDNDYRVDLLFDEEDFPNIYDSDKALVYLLVGYDPQIDADLWSMLPQTRFNQYGTYVYDYEFTREYASVLMDANFDKGLLNIEETFDKVFRVIIIPARATQRSATQIDYNDYHSVMKHYGLKESNVKRIQNRP